MSLRPERAAAGRPVGDGGHTVGMVGWRPSRGGSATVDWTRFVWTDTTSAGRHVDADGFTVRPSWVPRIPRDYFVADQHRHVLPPLTTLAGLEDVPVCAVIAERGGGKSTLFAAEHQRYCRLGMPSELIDLRRIPGAAMLAEDLAAARRALGSRVSTDCGRDGLVHLYVDLDEGLPADSCSRVLGRALRDFQGDFGRRLRIRISCRPPSWGVYADALERQMIGGAIPEVFLAPLCEEDVGQAALWFGLDAESVLEMVRERGIGPVAARPVTLFMLLDRLREGGRIPQTLSELMDEAVEGLCRRPASEAAGVAPRHLTVGVRRIATGLHLSGSAMLGLNGTDADDVLALEDLLGTESDLGAVVHVDWQLARAAADTGVFTATGVQTLALAHQIFADHLARRWLLSRQATPEQLIGILTGEGRDGRRRVLPRFSELAAMLASTVPAVFDRLLDIDPVALLRCDRQVIGDGERARIVRALLDLEDDTGVFDSGAPLLAALSCASAARVIGEALEAGGAVGLIRACRIASYLGDHGLNAVLLKLAADRAEGSDVRSAAARALSRPLDAEHAAGLAAAVSDPEVDNEVFAALLAAGWPGTLDADLVISLLDRRIGYVEDSSYTGLPIFQLWPAGTQDLIKLLAWTASKLNELKGPHGGGWLSVDVERTGSEVTAELLIRFLDDADPRLESTLVEALEASCLELIECPTPVDAVLQAAPSLRGRLGPAVLAAVSDRRVADALLHLTSLVAVPDDLGWFADFIAGEPPERRLHWSRRLVYDADLLDEEQFAALWALGDRLPEVAAWLRNRCSVQLDDRLHEPVGPERELLGVSDLEPVSIVSEPEFSARALAAALEADLPLLKRWNGVSTALPRRSKNIVRLHDHPDGDTLRRIPHDLRGNFLDLAQEVVATIPASRGRTAVEAAFGDDSDMARFMWHIDEHVMAGVGAWLLGFDARPEMAALIPADTALQWLRILLYVGEDGYSEHDLVVPRRVITALIGNVGPAQAATVILDEVSVLSARYGEPTVIELLRDAWRPELIREVVDRLDQVPPECAAALLQPLLMSGSTIAAEAALSILADQGGDLRRRGHVARALLFSDTACTTTIEALLLDESLSRIALHTLDCNHDLESSHWPAPVAAQSPELLGRLYRHLNTLYPVNGGADATQGYTETRLRDEVPDLIARHGTWAAARELSELAGPDTQTRWPRLVNRAARAALERDDQGHRLAVLERLTADPRHRIIDGSAQLLDVVTEALEAFHTELHGDLPLVSSLWDQTGTGRTTFKPKNEAKLSDEIARWLRRALAESGVVVNREVQVRRLRESAQNQSADIVVQATTAGPSPRTATVVIEVKCGWNRETLTAMPTQLAERYLARQPDAAGMYVVGWYLCPAWDPDDRRRRAAHRSLGTIESLPAELNTQARALQGRHLIRSHVLDLRI